jgi:hypothetical protein
MTLTILASASAPESDIPISVELSSPSRLFGIRSAGSQIILKPAGLPLFEYSTEHWKYQANDPEPGQLYELWLKFTHGDDVYYIPTFDSSLASKDPVGSVSEVDDDERRLQVKREQTPPESFGRYRGDSVRLRVTVTDANGVDQNVFGFQDDLSGSNFSFIASPFDPDIYPDNVAGSDQTPAYYLKNQIDVILPTPAAALALWEHILTELDVRIAAENRLDSLLNSSEQRIE